MVSDDPKACAAAKEAPFPITAQVLAPSTSRWLASLPREVAPRRLAAQHPRIANEMSERQASPLAMAAYLDSLLIDTRGNRQGFSHAIIMEMAMLRVSLEVPLMPEAAWGAMRSP